MYMNVYAHAHVCAKHFIPPFVPTWNPSGHPCEWQLRHISTRTKFLAALYDGTCYLPLTQTGATPLFIAGQNGHSDVVNILIRNGADVNLAKHVRKYSYWKSTKVLTLGVYIMHVPVLEKLHCGPSEMASVGITSVCASCMHHYLTIGFVSCSVHEVAESLLLPQ